MNIKNSSILLGGLVILNSFFWKTQQSTPMADERAAVEEAVDQFYLALPAMFERDVQPMTQVWSHTDDVSYMGPAGSIRIGWEEVLADWRAQADLNLGSKIEPSNFHYKIGPKIAVVINEEIGENTGPDGEALSNQIVFEYKNIEGTMVGFHFPESVGNANVQGFHFHFITKDKRHGGHLLDCQTVRFSIFLDQSSGINIVWPYQDQLPPNATGLSPGN